MLSTKSGYLAGFGTHFGALDNAENEFVWTYHNLGISIPHSPSFTTASSKSTLVASAFGVPSKLRVLIIALSPYLPLSVLDFVYDYLPGEGLALARENRRVAVKAAEDLVKSKIRETRGGKSGRDVLTLLGASDSWFPIGMS